MEKLKQPNTDIAIIGISCMTAGATDRHQFWQNIINGVTSITDIPPGRWDTEHFYSKNHRHRDKICSDKGGFIPAIPFDSGYFGMPTDQVNATEPLQLLSLEAVKMVLEDAGYSERPFDRDHTAVIVGTGGGLAELGHRYVFRTYLTQYFDGEIPDALLEQLPIWNKDSLPGVLSNLTAGRIANRFGFGGPNFVTDAACASSPTAVQMGVRELNAGTSDVAIVGGVDTYGGPFMYLSFSRTQTLSESGHCRPFDVNADGTVLGEGIGFIMLKRLADALRDGDRIYARIKGLGGSSDGRGKGLTTPNGDGQVRALERAYKASGVSPDTIGLIEAHGTGTVVGDSTEIEALMRVFPLAKIRPQSIPLGSIKSMVGHPKHAAGIISLIKTALAIHYKILPPTSGIDKPIPLLVSSPFYPNVRARPWIHSSVKHPRRAAVSAFGFGGANYHMVLEEDQNPGPVSAPCMGRPCELFCFRGESIEALHCRLNALKERLLDKAGGLFSLAQEVWNENRGLSGLTLTILADSVEDLGAKLEKALKSVASNPELEIDGSEGIWFFPAALRKKSGALAFLFPGQGAQYTDMFAELALYFAEIREAFEAVDKTLSEKVPGGISRFIFPPPAFSPDEKKSASGALARTEIAQPALGAVEMGMHALFKAFGITPDLCAGHSYGEYAALCAAGVWDPETLYSISEARGAIIRDKSGEIKGAMAAAQTDADNVLQALAGLETVWISNRNAPFQTVISGSAGSIMAATERLTNAGIGVKPLAVSCAFHSPLVAPARDGLAAILKSQRFNPPSLPVFSNLTGRPHQSSCESIATALCDHLVNGVDFVKEIESMYADGARIFVECGPRNILTDLVLKILDKNDIVAIAVDAPGTGGIRGFFHALAHLAARNVQVNLDRLYRRNVMSQTPEHNDKAEKNAGKSRTASWMVDGGMAWKVGNIQGSAENGRPIVKRIRLSDLAGKIETGSGKDENEMSNLNDTAGSNTGLLRDYFERQRQLTRQLLELQENMVLALGGVTAALPPLETGDFGSSLFSSATVPDVERTLEPAPAAPASQRESPASTVLAIVSERTGYQSDMLDLDANLEADLGIDSIKRTEISGAIRKRFTEIPAPVLQSMACAQSLRAIIDIVEKNVIVAPQLSKDAPPVMKSADAPSGESIASAVLDIVSERTGYQSDMLDLDSNLEADLGIDSIKRTELSGAIRKLFPALLQKDAQSIACAQTLRAIIDVVEKTASAPDDTLKTIELKNTNLDSPGAKPVARFKVVPVAVAAPSLLEVLSPGLTVIITSDDAGLARSIAERLREIKVDPILLINSANAESPGCLPMDLSNPAAIKETVERICAGATVAGVLHIAPLRPSPALRDMSFAQWQERTGSDCKSLLSLAQASFPFLDASLKKGLQPFFIGVVRDSILTADCHQQESAPWQGGVTGFINSLAIEWPNIHCRTIDIGLCAENERANSILKEISCRDTHHLIAYKDTERLAPKIIRHTYADTADAPVINSDSSIIITGGARGITSEIAIELATRFQPKLLLVGRSPFPEKEHPDTVGKTSKLELTKILGEQSRQRGNKPIVREIERAYEKLLADREIVKTIATLRDTGARVQYRGLDMATEAGVSLAIETAMKEFGRIDGVIHGAGVNDDCLVLDKKAESFSRVLDTKANSAFLLYRALARLPLRFFVFFSSVARLGSAGQADYAAANEIIDLFASGPMSAGNYKVASISWGPWLNRGMTEKLDRSIFEAKGCEMVRPIDGRAWFIDELTRGGPVDRSIILGNGPWNDK
jgi:acyl transferase domain-containing protein/NAD(P)-dependent dehydrogenase (short-subunit alcohol dehydrogenase family)/acyl carrier protein